MKFIRICMMIKQSEVTSLERHGCGAVTCTLVQEPISENCLDLIFAAPLCENVIIVTDTTMLHLQSENLCRISPVLVASKI